MTDRTCDEWAPEGKCVVRTLWEERTSVLCKTYGRCMYAAKRSSFTDEELEVLDAWSNGRVCLLAYRPNGWP